MKINGESVVSSREKHSYLVTAAVGGAVGAASTGVDLYITSKGKSTPTSNLILESLGSGLGLSRGDSFIKNEKFLNFAKSKFGAMSMGIVGGAVGLVIMRSIIDGITSIFKKKD